MRIPGLKGVHRENINMAVSSLRANKVRSFLTILGVVVGVMTVVVIASILTGMRKNVTILIDEFGTNNLWAFHLTTGFQLGHRDRKEWTRKPMTTENGLHIKEQAPAVQDVGWVLYDVRTDRTMTYGGNTYKQGSVRAVSPNFGEISHLSMEQGRFFSEMDDLHRRDVLVIGPDVVKALFPNTTQVAGRQVTLGGRRYDIIGVIEKRKGSFLGESEDDNAIFMPHRTALKFSPLQEYLLLIIQAKEGQLPAAYEQVESILRRERGVKFNEENNFDLKTADRFMEQFDSIFAAIGMIAIAISGVGLLVGGIGVMNIMLVSVTERTREIGVRKAIGARRRDIVVQFLFEAMTLTSVGGLIGIFLSLLTSVILHFLLPDLPATIPLWAVIAGLGVSIFVGVVFGVWPARTAAQLDPIECLRYE
jgi:putative ABC transport system permease protein